MFEEMDYSGIGTSGYSGDSQFGDVSWLGDVSFYSGASVKKGDNGI